ncbi:MAG: 4Fe-4S binding protein [Deltaproteobacteria bacterium]|nr:4Fe-4S binding protein [Deltaproteobacteria bacterium]
MTTPAPNRKWSTWVWARRSVQILSLGTFLWLVLGTDLSPARPGDASGLPMPVRVFFELDPFLALSTLLGTGILYKGLVLALLTAAVTLVLGRVFCGWLCPLGTLQHAVAWLRRKLPAGRRRARNTWHPAQRTKYGVLLAALGAALAGSSLVALLDPIAIAFRGLALSVMPAVGHAARRTMDALYAADYPLAYGGDGIRYLIAQGWLPYRDAVFQSSLLIGGLLLAVLGLSLWRPRFFCRFACPLGALLGLFSRFSILWLRKDPSRCNACRKCLDHCQGADGPEDGVPWRKAECHVCLNCVASCPEKALQFQFSARGLPSPDPNRALQGAAAGEAQPRAEARGSDGEARSAPAPAPLVTIDTRRRTLVAAFASGIVAVPLLRTSPLFAGAPDPLRIRPPGARPEREFLARCVRCGECMKVCPTNALHPAVGEAGVEGLWTPVLVPRIGACQPGCTLCGQVCPTGAIRRFTSERKLGADGHPPLRIGTAKLDRGSCIPWATGQTCTVCEEFCPTSPKAIRLDPGETPSAPLLPVVVPERCNGCGACEHVCPLAPSPAIVVTATGESRADEHDVLGR